MPDTVESSGSGKIPTPPALHPVYTVTNIQNKVRILDGTKVTYSSWVKLFQLNARGYKVLDHIDGTKPPAKDDTNYDLWMEIDAIVLQWIYATLSDELLVRVLEQESTALEAWVRLKNIFLNNKGSRAAALDDAFTNLTLKSMPSLQAYCQKLRELAGQLADVDCPVDEKRLVMKLVRGLPPEYDVVAAQLNQLLPSWEDAVNLLDSEERRQKARENPSFVAAATHTTPSNTSDSPAPHRENTYRGQPRSGQQRRNNGPRPNRGPTSQNGQQRPPQPRNGPWTSSSQQWPPYTPWWVGPTGSPAGWAPPPCPYPTQAGWASPWQQGFQQPSPRPNGNRPATGSTSRTSPQAHITDYDPLQPTHIAEAFQAVPTAQPTEFDPLQPTDIGEAFHAFTMDSGDPNWIMDTGASNHLHADSGLQDWEDVDPSRQ
ncbi:uncharacterized protein LOC118487132 [Helianthus annuus]|uniref:uncharacterized protein LOC118487132 n=1 Tax=Helianthus annuus TaxID=4232 RepID=UPI0016533980|nr:uncharacterized protein LOC118487132 [Helianthus annuus]